MILGTWFVQWSKKECLWFFQELFYQFYCFNNEIHFTIFFLKKMLSTMKWCFQMSPMKLWPTLVQVSVKELLTAVAISALVEQLFSWYDLVHSKLRKKMDNEKAGKLVYLYRALNSMAQVFVLNKLINVSSEICLFLFSNYHYFQL